MAEPQVTDHAENSTSIGTKIIGFRPGNPYRFRKGLSGNPGGRPRKVLADVYEQMLEQIIPHDAECEALRRRFHLAHNARWKHAIAAAMIQRALESTEAAQEIANRVEGKVTQPVAIDRPLDLHMEPLDSPLCMWPSELYSPFP